jgi:hypothetical protein
LHLSGCSQLIQTERDDQCRLAHVHARARHCHINNNPRDVRRDERAREGKMFALDLNARLENREKNVNFAKQMLQMLARAGKPRRVPYDYREIERFKAEFERKKLDALMITRFKAM